MPDSDQFIHALTELERSFSLIGLKLNYNRSEFSISRRTDSTLHTLLSDIRRVMPDIDEVDCGDLSLLGSHLDADSLYSTISQCKRKVELMCERVQNLDAHWALFFITKYASAPRFNHILRTSPAYQKSTELRAVDEVVRETLAKCSNVNFAGGTCSCITWL